MLNTVTIKLGDNCNFACRHCCQHEHTNEVEEGLAIKPEVIEFVRKHAKEVMGSGSRMPLRLRLWGGEPLMYFDQIIGILDRLQDVRLQPFLVTNGMLLTDEIVDYCNKYKIGVALSNDGENTAKIRNINVLEFDEICRLHKRLNSCMVTTVLSAYSQDLPRTWGYIRSKLGENVAMNTELLMASPDMPADICNFDVEAFEVTMREVVDMAVANIGNHIIHPAFYFIEHFAILTLKILLGHDIQRKMLGCGQMYKNVTTDGAGNVYPCHNFGGKIASIDMPHEEILKIYHGSIKTTNAFAECAGCECVRLCRGHCPFVPPSPNKAICCEIRRVFFRGILDFINKFEGVL